ncbi:MAG: ABC transporter permease [Pseudomarimonas sp.]
MSTSSLSARWVHHLFNETRRALYLSRRYWLETLLGLGLVTSLFGGLLFAVLQTSDSSLAAGGVDGLIVGFAIWLFASAAAQGPSSEVIQETEQRSLEQLSLAPIRLDALLAFRLLLDLLGGLTLLMLTLGVAHLLTAGRVTPSPAMLGLAILGVPALVGVGYALAGLMLLVKRGEVLVMIGFPVLIGLIALPAYPINALAWLPYALCAAAARAAAVGEHIPAEVCGWIALNGVLYLVAGRYLFVRLLRRARELGVLGHF